MIKIKLSIPGFKQADISQFTGNKNNIIDNCIFYINRDDITVADFWVCLEAPYKSIEVCKLNKKNVIFLTSEVAWPKLFYDSELKKNFLAQFGQIYTCHDIYNDNVVFDLPYLPWMINANHGNSIFSSHSRDRIYFENLMILPKTKQISVFCSNQSWTVDHNLRLKFVKAIKSHFGDKIDWFGNGINPIDKKWDGIAPYKYHIVLENQSRNNVITEKLYDSFLGLAYPIYYGAPNASSFFNPESFSTIDISDLKGSIKKIENILKNDLYEKLLPSLIDSKNLVINKYNLFERIAKICNTKKNEFSSPTFYDEDIVLMPMNQFSVKKDMIFLLQKGDLVSLLRKLSLYYPGQLFKKISTFFLSNYEKIIK
jgi:hypothetical protein